jgi:hypothetical protein
MPAKPETPRARGRNPNADATEEPWRPKGQHNSPGKRPGPPSPGGRKGMPRRSVPREDPEITVRLSRAGIKALDRKR